MTEPLASIEQPQMSKAVAMQCSTCGGWVMAATGLQGGKCVRCNEEDAAVARVRNAADELEFLFECRRAGRRSS